MSVQIEKISTGVRNLDLILKGGIPKYSVNIIAGSPGSGKTILAQQIVFANASHDSKAPYLVTVSEPMIKMLRYQQQFTYFDREKLDEGAVLYLNISDVVSEEGLSGTIKAIGEYFTKFSPAILVIDSFKAIHDLITSPTEIRTLGYELSVILSAGECTSFLVGEYDYEDIVEAPIFAIADGIIMLETDRRGMQDMRFINVVKMRGDGYFRGRHPFRITSDGIQVFPRIKTPEVPSPMEMGGQKLSCGVGGLDEMLGGGLPSGSVSLVAGAAGTGKTLLGLHFVAEGVEKGEPGVYVTFQETPANLRRTARAFGWDMEEMERQGRLKIVYTSPVEMSVDEHTALIKDSIEAVGAQRVVIDSLMDIEIATPNKVRFKDYVYSLVNYFRAQGVTSLLTNEIPNLFGTLQLSEHGISFVSDNVILLRYVEIESRITRAINVLKMRGSKHDTTLREFRITPPQGLEILEPFERAQGLMSGMPTILQPSETQFEALLAKMTK